MFFWQHCETNMFYSFSMSRPHAELHDIVSTLWMATHFLTCSLIVKTARPTSLNAFTTWLWTARPVLFVNIKFVISTLWTARSIYKGKRVRCVNALNCKTHSRRVARFHGVKALNCKTHSYFVTRLHWVNALNCKTRQCFVCYYYAFFAA